jgi:hypothetical protein
MSNKDNNKPGGKPDQRNRKAGRKPDQRQSPKPDQQKANVRIDATAASTGTPIGAIAAADIPSIAAATTPVDNLPIDAAVAPVDASGAEVASAQTVPVSLQTIATAYGDYTKKSFEETKSFVEKLSGVRSLDKAVEIQTEFAKQAYETFVTESQKIRELYSGLAKQSLKPLESLVAKVTQAGR